MSKVGCQQFFLLAKSCHCSLGIRVRIVLRSQRVLHHGQLLRRVLVIHADELLPDGQLPGGVGHQHHKVPVRVDLVAPPVNLGKL